MNYEPPVNLIQMGPLVYGIDEEGYIWIDGIAGRSWRRTRDQFCSYCGERLIQGSPLQHRLQKTRDHIHPKALEGDPGFDNTTPACYACNQIKAAEPLLSYLLKYPVGTLPVWPRPKTGKATRRRLTPRQRKRAVRRERRLAGFKGDQLARALDHHRSRLLRALEKKIVRSS